MNVELYDHSRDVELLIGKLWLREERIHCDDADAYQTMTIHWVDEKTLVINGESYEIE